MLTWFNRRRKLGWMQTFSGVRYWPADPRVADVRIVDISHALSNLCRYTGHVRIFYSVAEHSIHVSYIVPPEHALTGLLHDATEAYTNDINRPLKMSLPDYRRIEARNWAVVAEKFGLPVVMPAEVHAADHTLLRTEQVALMPYCDLTPHWREHAVPGLILPCWPPVEAEAKFMQRFYELTSGLGSRAQPSDWVHMDGFQAMRVWLAGAKPI